MATGVPKLQDSDFVAVIPSMNPYNINYNHDVTINYHHKLEDNIILEPIYSNFLDVLSSDKILNIRTNDLILGDNIYSLHKLIQDGIKVDLIYLDPPYNTGFSFETREKQHAYDDKYHLSSYLENMRIRLILLREILSDEGSIYLHIGYQMMPYLKMIMDEIFGEKNCRNIITRRKCSSKNSTKKQYSNVNDFILFYTKGPNYIWVQQGKDVDAEWIKKEYSKVDDKGQYKLVPIHAPGRRNGETGQPWRGNLPPDGKHWQYIPSKLDELDKKGEIHWSRNGNPRRKVYLTPDKKLAYTDYWENFRDAHHQSIKITGYPTEKNLDMLKLIISSSSLEGSLVIDPFCGSGSTLQAASNLGRNWVGIDQSFSAIQHTVNRFKFGTKKMGDYVSEPSPQIELITDEKLINYRLIVEENVFNVFKEEIKKLI